MTDPMVTNICFHGIGRPARALEAGESAYWIGVDSFHWFLDELAGRDDVAISFDDGNLSDVVVGLPALLERGQTATFFALAGRLGQPGSLADADLRQLRSRGMTIGSHGMRHIPWRGLSLQARQEEFVRARELLAEASSGPVQDAALPLGRYDRGVLRGLRDLGYRHVFSSDRLPARQGGWFQPRYSVGSSDTLATVRHILAGPSYREAALTRLKIGLKRVR